MRVTEQSIQFGPGGGLVGTIAEAAAPERAAAGWGLVLSNAGLVHRVGPHRLNVKLARLAASRGVPSIRFDLSGRGDSGPGQRGNDHRSQAVSDIGCALTELERRAPVRRYMIFGVCSGADDGFAAAIREPRIAALVMFDPCVFATPRWRARLYLGKFRKFGALGGLARLRELRAAQGWQDDAVRGNFGRPVPPIGAFADDLRTLCERGVSVRLVYSGSQLDRRDYETQCRMLLGRHDLAGRVGAEFLPDVDHVVTSLAAQQRVMARFEAWLDELRATP
jgi:hypothetical protein